MELISPLNPRPRASNARLGMFMTLLILLAVGMAFARTEGFEWFVLKNAIRAKYPNVRRITTAQLADWLADPQREKPVLLDVRTEPEWNVSHLAGARRIDPGAPADLVGVPRNAPIVTYCSVGYRSSEMARRLLAAGFINVQNLEGSVFEWGNEHRPLVAGGQKVARVHPDNGWWGRLLADDVRAPVESR
ncbi:MAG: rhodanese-like domain-containing protein [Chthoniobacterales bacterium]